MCFGAVINYKYLNKIIVLLLLLTRCLYKIMSFKNLLSVMAYRFTRSPCQSIESFSIQQNPSEYKWLGYFFQFTELNTIVI